jgi:hypothetical protein
MVRQIGTTFLCFACVQAQKIDTLLASVFGIRGLGETLLASAVLILVVTWITLLTAEFVKAVAKLVDAFQDLARRS